jgi:hypothetical protein
LYRSLREPILPVAFVPFHGVDKSGALLPAGLGLYGVLDHSLLQAAARNPHSAGRGRQGEPYCGARHTRSIRHGAGGGSCWARTGDPAALAPALTIVAATLLAAVPAVVRALRIDPAKMLRSE